MAINYPGTVVTGRDKLEYLYILQEKLRGARNAKGKDFRNNVITKEQWEQYVDSDYQPKMEVMLSELAKAKEVLKKSTRYNPSMEIA